MDWNWMKLLLVYILKIINNNIKYKWPDVLQGERAHIRKISAYNVFGWSASNSCPRSRALMSQHEVCYALYSWSQLMTYLWLYKYKYYINWPVQNYNSYTGWRIHLLFYYYALSSVIIYGEFFYIYFFIILLPHSSVSTLLSLLKWNHII